MDVRYTPENISSLGKDEVFVFGSNLAGRHNGGAARVAYERFGAIMGQGVGMPTEGYRTGEFSEHRHEESLYRAMEAGK